MGTAWIGDRIYQPTLDEVLLGTYMGETPNTYYAKKMYYPIGGGVLSVLKRDGGGGDVPRETAPL